VNTPEVVEFMVEDYRLCTGVVLASGYVLSVAHCFARLNEEQLQAVTIKAGTQILPVISHVMHPDYDVENIDSVDLMVVKVSGLRAATRTLLGPSTPTVQIELPDGPSLGVKVDRSYKCVDSSRTTADDDCFTSHLSICHSHSGSPLWSRETKAVIGLVSWAGKATPCTNSNVGSQRLDIHTQWIFNQVK